MDKEITGEEIFSMSFYDNTLNCNLAKQVIQKTTRPILYTYGLEYRHPTIHRVPITKDEALKYINKQSHYIDITATESLIHINEFSGNDMW